MASKNNDIKRRPGKLRRSRSVTAVGFDGEKTEAEYFKGWERKLGTVGVVLAPFYVRSGGNALRAVEACKQKATREGPFDEIWCVCDIDDTSAADLLRAKALAAKYKINLCLSSRCFEVWIALHWSRISLAAIKNESEAVALVAQYHKEYSVEKKHVPFELLFSLTEDACHHATWLVERNVENPTTSVQNLVTKLLEIYKKRASKKTDE